MGDPLTVALALGVGLCALLAQRAVVPRAPRPSGAPARAFGPAPRAARHRLPMDASADAALVRLRSSLAAGATVVVALGELAEAGGPWSLQSADALGLVTEEVPLSEALEAWADACADPAATLAAQALAIASETGASLVRALDAALGAVRERAELQREVRALSSQARASAVLLVVTPIAFALLVLLVDARVRAFYASPPGAACVAIGVALDLAGAGWLRRQVAAVR